MKKILSLIMSISLFSSIFSTNAISISFENFDNTTLEFEQDDNIEIQMEELTPSKATEDNLTEIHFDDIKSETKQKESVAIQTDNIDDFQQKIVELNQNAELESDNIYVSKKLIVISNSSDFETYNAENILAYGNIYVLSYVSEKETKKAYELLSKNNKIVSVEIDSIVETSLLTDANIANSELLGSETLKEDIVLDENKENVDSNKQEIDKEVEEKDKPNRNPNHIKIAVIDSGIDKSNPLFDERIIDLGFNFSTSGDGIQDDNGHGTAVASIIAKNSDAYIMPIKIANSDGKGTVLSLYLAIQVAIENNVDIINLSMTTSSSELLSSIIEEADKAGIKVVASAGNESANVENYAPANIDSVITVASLDHNYKPASYSNYGEMIDYSAIGTDLEVNGLQGLEIMSGTSLSTAYVSAIMAYAMENNKNFDEYVYPIENRKEYYGNGIVSFVEVKIPEKEPVDVEGFDFKIKQSLIEENDRNNYQLEILTNENVEYTFDGGETWQKLNYIQINRNQEFYDGEEYMTSIRSLGIRDVNSNTKFKDFTVIDCNNPKDSETLYINLEAAGMTDTTTSTGSGYYDSNADSTVTYTYTNFDYNINTLTATLTGCTSSNTATNRSSLTLTSTVYVKHNGTKKTLTVTAIGNGSSAVSMSLYGSTKGETFYTVKKVTIPASVTSINPNAFKNKTDITTVTFASSSKCTFIGNNAFYGCTTLTAITIPNSVTTIEDYAFYNCSALATVTLGTGIATLRYNTFRGTTPLTTLTINSNISSHNNVFKEHMGLTTLKIGSNLTNIYTNMFQRCSNLSKVDITGSNVTSIGAYAFEGCKKLNTKNAFDYAAFDASLSGAVGEYAFRFGGFTSSASAGLPSVSVSQTVVQDNNYFPTSGGIGKVTMNISASPTTANEGKDYIVILDTTGSMNNKVNGVSKMETAKKSLQTFADTIMEENSENRIAIVHFRGNVDDDTNSAGYCYLDFTKDKSTITTKITNLKANAGGAQIVKAGGSNTNYRLGIIAALNVMQMRGAESSVTAGGVTYGASGGADRNTYVVFISDGAANAQTSYITPLSKILKAAADEIWSIGICVENSGETTEYLQMINTTIYGQDLFIDFPSADLEAAMTAFLKQVVSMSTSSIYNTILTSVIQSNWTPYKDSSHMWSSGVTNSGQNVSVNIGAMGKESKSYTFYVKLIDAYKTGTMTSKGTYNPIVTNNIHADYKVSGGIYEGQSKTALNTQQYTLPWYAYDIIYNGNGNTGGSTSNQVKIGGINLSLRNNGFTKTAYRFKEWNTKADGTGIKYEPGTSYSTNADLILYAIWEPDTTYYTVKHWKQNIGGITTIHNATNYTEVTTDRQMIENVTIGSNQSPTVKRYTGFTSPVVQTVTIAANGATVVNYYYTRNNYTVTYIDVIDSQSGRELGRSTASKPYNSTVRGADKGSSTTDNAYYNGYYYVSDTSATVNTSGATVYRIFKQRMNTIAGNIIWEDWNNKNLSRPENVNLYIKGSDGKTYSYVITGNHSQNTSVNSWPYSYNLPKYDSNGNVIVYTVSQDKAISQEEGLYYQEPIVNGYNITNKATNKPIGGIDPYPTKVTITITWDDENDFYGFRPETATIQLLRNGEVIKTADVSDSYTFTDLLKYDENGNKYVYTIQASDEKRYTKVENNSAPYNKTVTYTFVESSFSVLIPKVIVLNGNKGNADYDITVNGAFYYNDTLTVKPANSFTMTDRNNISQMKANILQSKQSFMKSDIASNESKTTGSIQVDRSHFAGLWSGTFNFDIKFVMKN